MLNIHRDIYGVKMQGRSGEGGITAHDVTCSLHNYSSAERHLVKRKTYNLRCSAALIEWQSHDLSYHGHAKLRPVETISYPTDNFGTIVMRIDYVQRWIL